MDEASNTDDDALGESTQTQGPLYLLNCYQNTNACESGNLFFEDGHETQKKVSSKVVKKVQGKRNGTTSKAKGKAKGKKTAIKKKPPGGRKKSVGQGQAKEKIKTSGKSIKRITKEARGRPITPHFQSQTVSDEIKFSSLDSSIWRQSPCVYIEKAFF